ncbi:Atu4866 domain-containing protein [Phreatobacter sp. AB_2022a]|uniref:Atu4866 domain-containing protein n=1 Tax=Phreatobacter sp. AB_2022a TaxID=3003134 RepID=UPI002286EDED|nr:Atu4866 domain-containing protein [Phreatobacter sp. AB_2022a]MCZ0733317.1 Atu4866 domain-containing protein [Phreatobacter sp. AB_2022a]
MALSLRRTSMMAASVASLIAAGPELAVAKEPAAARPAGDAVVGMWVTANGFIRLELMADGRYDEARGQRRSAYRGRYEVRGPQLVFFDDSGFTATGIVTDGVLRVGGDAFRRE